MTDPGNFNVRLQLCVSYLLISQEVELLEACRYGLVREVPYLLQTGANVNIATFVSSHS